MFERSIFTLRSISKKHNKLIIWFINEFILVSKENIINYPSFIKLGMMYILNSSKELFLNSLTTKSNLNLFFKINLCDIKSVTFLFLKHIIKNEPELFLRKAGLTKNIHKITYYIKNLYKTEICLTNDACWSQDLILRKLIKHDKDKLYKNAIEEFNQLEKIKQNFVNIISIHCFYAFQSGKTKCLKMIISEFYMELLIHPSFLSIKDGSFPSYCISNINSMNLYHSYLIPLNTIIFNKMIKILWRLFSKFLRGDGNIYIIQIIEKILLLPLTLKQRERVIPIAFYFDLVKSIENRKYIIYSIYENYDYIFTNIFHEDDIEKNLYYAVKGSIIIDKYFFYNQLINVLISNKLEFYEKIINTAIRYKALSWIKDLNIPVYLIGSLNSYLENILNIKRLSIDYKL